MKTSSRQLVAALLIAGGLCMGPASAQDFPSRPVRLVVGNTPATPPDILARAIAPGMSKALGQPLVVENKPGGGGLVAYEYVAKQVPADGYALVVAGTGLATFQVFIKDLRFDPLKDIAPVSLLAEGAVLLTSPAAAPWNTFNEMVGYAKANPGRINYASTGPQSLNALQGEALKQKHGIDIVQIPYKGAGGYEMSVVTNEVQLGFLGIFQIRPNAARLKVLATSGAARLPEYPQVPTFTEFGLPEIGGFWTLLAAPQGVPRPVIDRLYGAVTNALALPEVRELLEKKMVLQILGASPEASAKRIRDEATAFAATAKRAGLVPE